MVEYKLTQVQQDTKWESACNYMFDRPRLAPLMVRVFWRLNTSGDAYKLWGSQQISYPNNPHGKYRGPRDWVSNTELLMMTPSSYWHSRAVKHSIQAAAFRAQGSAATSADMRANFARGSAIETRQAAMWERLAECSDETTWRLIGGGMAVEMALQAGPLV